MPEEKPAQQNTSRERADRFEFTDYVLIPADEAEKKYDPNQPRDESGQWGSGGFSGGGSGDGDKPKKKPKKPKEPKPAPDAESETDTPTDSGDNDEDRRTPEQRERDSREYREFGSSIPEELIADNWQRGGVTPNDAEAGALEYYRTDAGAMALNGNLRSGGELTPEVRAQAEHLDRVLGESTLDHDAMLYRGISPRSPQMQVITQQIESGQLRPGAIIQDNGYASTSLNDRVATGTFAESSGVVFEISAPAGSRGLYVSGAMDRNCNCRHGSEYRSEREVLLPRGANFRVTNIEQRGGRYHVQVTYDGHTPPALRGYDMEIVEPVETGMKTQTLDIEPVGDGVSDTYLEHLKAGRVLSGVNAEAIRNALSQLLDVLQRAGIDVSDVQPDEAPEAVMARKFSPDDLIMTVPQPDTAIKALDENGRIGGYLVVWGSPEQRDLQGEYFTPETEFHPDWYPRRPALYHHGIDGTLKAMKIGEIDTLRPDEVGLWAEAQLELRNQYVRMVKKLIDKGVLGWSSGSLPHLVEIEADGRIKSWAIVEGSATPAPAEPFRTQISTTKAYYAAVKALPLPDEHEAEEEVVTDEPGSDTPPPPTETGATPIPIGKPTQARKATKMDIQSYIAAMQEQGIEADKILAVIAKLGNGDTPAAVAAVEPEEEAAVYDEEEMKAAAKAVALEAVREAMKGITPESQVQPVTEPQITGVKNRLYDYAPLNDLVAAAMLMQNSVKSNLQGEGAAPAPSDTLLRALHTRLSHASTYDNNLYGREGAMGLKTALASVKANELFSAVTNTQFVSEAWDTRVIETVRETPMYQELLSRGMLERTIPQGAATLKVPVEGNDPEAYALVEQNDITSDERLPVTAKTGTVTAANQTVQAGMVGIRLAYTYISEEDMIVNAGQYVDYKINRVMPEKIENIIFQGDTETANTTNINFIDGQPSVDAKGRGPHYLTSNGLFKLALVTTTSLSRDAANTLSENDFLNTLKLLPAAQQTDYSRLMFVLDASTSLAALAIPVFKTKDVSSFATIESGRLVNAWGIDVFRSGFIGSAAAQGKTNAAGKIDSTAGNNTRGRILLVRPDRWILGMKRQMTTESQRDIDAQATVVVSTTRFCVVPVATSGGVAVSYNIAVA